MNQTETPPDPSTWYRAYDLAAERRGRVARDPAPHQQRALDKLGKWYRTPEDERGGILVLPTGGGKTFVATHFLCRGPLSDGQRILWLAHTHHLLEQANEAFGRQVRLVQEPVDQVRVRVVSGAVGHFRPAHIKPEDNVLLCSLQTATRAFEKRHPRFLEFLDAAADGLFVVFDEARHAPAPSYRRLLRGIRERRPRSGLLGLTATPGYADERRQGWLKQLFPQGIVAQEDAAALIAAGVLARPIMEDVATQVTPEFDERQYRLWVSTHRDLPESIITRLAENQGRNDRIVAQYAHNRTKYGKTIMFADRWFQCDYLVEALKKRGVRADAVYSRVVSVPGGADVRNRRRMGENAGTLQRFKNNELDVLINVQMLTEGTDVPDAQTVFLTRQTTSHILLKQMVGRALRGPRFGGTEDAYIVAFIDDWRQHIDWAAYDQIEEGARSTSGDRRGPRPPLHLISIELVRRLARQMDTGVNIAPWPYTALLPVGWYQVEYDAAVGTGEDGSSDGDPDTVEQVRNLVMVYQDERPRFDRFLDRIEGEDLLAFESTTIEKEEVLNRLTAWRDALFDRDEDRPGGDLTDGLLDLARHLAQQEKERPEFFSFEDTRKNHDLDALAREYMNEGARTVDQVLRAEYTKRDRLWRVFYPRYDQFKSQYDACINRILHVEVHGSDVPDHAPPTPPPVPPPRFPELEPSDETKKEVLVRDNHRCLCCGNDNRRALQVDHIVPKYLRVDHRIENLQTLCGTCNRHKGDTEIIDFRNHRTTLTAAPDGFPNARMPSGPNAKDPRAVGHVPAAVRELPLPLRRDRTRRSRRPRRAPADLAALVVPRQPSGVARTPPAGARGAHPATTGPFTTTMGPEKYVVQSRPCMVNSGRERRLHHREDDRHVLGLAAGHHRVDRDLLDRAGRVVRRDRADHLLRIAGRAPEHAQHPHRGRRDHGQPVAPAAGEAELVLVLGRVHVDDPRLQGRGSEGDLQNFRHAGGPRSSSRSPAGSPAARRRAGSSPVTRVHSARSQPTVRSASAPSSTRMRVGTVSTAKRHECSRARSSTGSSPRRKRRIVLGVDGQRRAARRDLAQHRLHEVAGGAVALGDDDELRARAGHSSFACRSSSGRTSSRPFGGMVTRARKQPASR